jgi:hypothetical protein
MVLEYDGTKYLVGEIAKNEGGCSTFDKNNHLRHIICTLAGIALANDNDYHGSIVMGLPISDFKTKKREIESLRGKYNFNLCDASFMVYIPELAVIPQGAAAFYDMILSDNGKSISGSQALGKYIGIIDIGEKTLDFVTINHDQFIMEQSGSLDLGMNKAYLRLCSVIQQQLGFSIMPNQAPEYIRRIPKETNTEYRKLANEIIDGISRWWNFNQFDIIYLAGGGGAALQEFIAERIKCNLISEAQFSNARGYYKWGMAKETNR